MSELTLTQRQEKIILLRQQKEELYPDVAAANKEYQKIRQEFHQKEQAYFELRRKYEALDREEKLLTFVKPVKSKPTTKAVPTNMAKAKNTALKALDSLPPELQAQILKNFKKG